MTTKNNYLENNFKNLNNMRLTEKQIDFIKCLLNDNDGISYPLLDDCVNERGVLEVAEKILDEGLAVAGSSYTRDYYKYLEDDNGFIFNVDTIKREDLEELIVSYIWEYL